MNVPDYRPMTCWRVPLSNALIKRPPGQVATPIVREAGSKWRRCTDLAQTAAYMAVSPVWVDAQNCGGEIKGRKAGQTLYDWRIGLWPNWIGDTFGRGSPMPKSNTRPIRGN